MRAYNSGMASWIIHLRIAEDLLERIPGLDPEGFALGSVGPDSGKPDEKWEKFTPSTLLTHFQDERNARRSCADLDFFRRYLLPLQAVASPDSFSFRLGFFFHLITDNLWSREIGLPTQQRWAEEFAADREFIWEVKKDWYGLDFIHVRDHPGCLFWRVFRDARPQDGGLDFLVPDSLAWSVAHIQQYYQSTDAEVQSLYDRPYIYLTAARADRFVDESVQILIRIYEHVWITGMDTQDAMSALDLNIFNEAIQ
jgi:hypothetical protein